MTWVHDQIYAAGGEHIPNNWQTFADQTGISAIIHLRNMAPVQFRGLRAQAFLWLNLDDESQATVNDRLLVAQFLEMCLQNELRVLLHSNHGRHRVRWIVVAYLILAGRSVRGAIREVEERPWLAPYHTQVDSWQSFFERVKKLA